jgi:outer membrane protein
VPDLRAVAAALLLACVPPIGARAQSLSDAYRAALSRDPDWLGAKEDEAAGRENEALARSLFRPKVGVAAGTGFVQSEVDVSLPPSISSGVPRHFTGGLYDGSLQLVQPIVDGAASAQARQLRALARGSEAQFASARQQLMLRVADAYFAVLAARDALASIKAREASARREQESAQARFDAGRAKITDVREAQSQADAAGAQAVTAAASLDVAVARFNELTGLDGAAVVPLNSDLVPLPPTESLEDWQERGESKSPLVIARARAYDAARAKADQSRWSSQVKVNALGSLTETGRLENGGLYFPQSFEVFSIGVRINVPLYSGGAIGAQERQAEAQARSAGRALDAARRDVRLGVEQAWTGQSSGVASIRALRTALASARLQEQAAVTGREVGVRTESDVLAALAQVIETERRLKEAIRDYELSRLSLYASAGVLNEEQLAELDLDVAHH